MRDTEELILSLCAESGPSGCEDSVSRLIERELAPYADGLRRDALSNLIAVKRCGREGARSVALCAHMDEIGFIVTGHEKGYLRFSNVGGVDARMLPASELLILAEEPLLGVVDVMPPHALSDEEMDKPIAIDKLYIDTGLGEQEARERIPLGTRAVYAGGAFRLGENMLAGKALDDRSCCAVIMKTLEALCGRELNVDLYLLFSTQEEVGTRGSVAGAYGVAPDYAIITDVTFGDSPDTPKIHAMKLGGGPAVGRGPFMSRALTEHIADTAKGLKMEYQTEVMASRTGTDGDSFQTSREGVATALVSLPLRYMHTPVEVINLTDADNMIKLLAESVAGLGEVL